LVVGSPPILVLLFSRGVTTQAPFNKLPVATATPTTTTPIIKRNSRTQTKRNLLLSTIKIDNRVFLELNYKEGMNM
jgi:hypothetical protein